MRNVLAVCIVLVLLNTAIYIQTRNFDFVIYDDGEHVYENLGVQRGLTRDNLRWVFQTTFVGNYIPVTGLTFLLDSEIHGPDPGGYHLTNLLFHCANSLLLLLLLARASGAFWPSALVAALFAVHPLHVESVAWISARKDVVSTFFWLLATLTYLRYTHSRRLRTYLLTVVLFVLGLLSKPMLVTFPMVLLLLDHWPLKRTAPGASAISWKGLVIEKVPLFAIAGLFSALTVYVQRMSEAVAPVDVVPLMDRLLNAFTSYLAYIGKTAWPVELVVFYPHPGSGAPVWSAVAGALVLALVSIVCIALRSKRPYLLVGWLWYLGTLVPVIGLVQVGGQAMADRYTYVPLTGLFIMLAWGLRDLAAVRPGARPAIAVAIVAAVLALAITARVQVRHWRDTVSLFEHALRHSPDNLVALSNLGAIHVKREEYEAAIPYIVKSLAHRPRSIGNRRNLALSYRKTGRLEEARGELQRALKIQTDDPVTHNDLALVLTDQGYPQLARIHLETALELDPGYLDAEVNLGNVLLGLDEPLEAVRFYLHALQGDPQHVGALTNLGAALIALKDYTEAETRLRHALELAPFDAVTRVNLAVALYRLGRADEARGEVEEALRIDPEYQKAKDFQKFMSREGHVPEPPN